MEFIKAHATPEDLGYSYPKRQFSPSYNDSSGVLTRVSELNLTTAKKKRAQLKLERQKNRNPATAVEDQEFIRDLVRKFSVSRQKLLIREATCKKGLSTTTGPRHYYCPIQGCPEGRDVRFYVQKGSCLTHMRSKHYWNDVQINEWDDLCGFVLRAVAGEEDFVIPAQIVTDPNELWKDLVPGTKVENGYYYFFFYLYRTF